jgi:starch-binding outer membrane protein, SusD/RagB family
MKKIIMISMLLTAMVFGCKKNFLDKQPLSTASVKTLFADADGLKLAVNGIYDIFQGDIWGGSFYYLPPHFDAISEDAIFCCAWEGQIMSIAQGDVTPASGGIVDFIWKFGYKGIARANAVLANVDNADIKIEDSIRVKYKAEVRFLRALIYFDLANNYGGVPLILNPVDISNSKLPRSTKEEVIKAVLDDLDYAATNLNTTPLNGDIGRPTKQAALALSTRVLLYQKKWAEAAAQAKKVMALESGNVVGLATNYASLFDGSNKADKEILFSIQFTGASASSADVGEGNMLGTVYGPRNVESGGGWGSISYQETMFDAFYMKDGLPKNLSPLYDPAKPYANRDSRLYGSFFVPGISVWNGKTYTEDNYASAIAELPLNTKKWAAPQDNNTSLAGSANFIKLRYADVLLMYAEAQNESVGPDNSVYSALNKVRGRALMPDVTPGLSKDQMTTVIRHERKVELSQEGLRYYDIMRWGIAKQLINSNKRQVRNWHDYNNLLPIPQSERNVNPKLEQNPGYPQ